MSITLDAVTLPAAMIWTDEFAAQSVQQTVKRTLAGGVVVFHAPVTAGVNITLESNERTGWMTRTQVEAVKALADSPGLVMALVLRGVTYSVIFRHNDPPAFEAEPLFPFANPQADDYYIARIRLMTV